VRLDNLSYLTLWAVNFDEVKTVYKDVLGLPVAQESDNFIMFETKGSRLAFHRLGKAPPLARPSVELHLEVDDVDEVYSSLKSKGVNFEASPANHPWGTRSAGFRDPEGYTVELVGPLKVGEPTLGE
jgi:catechol 2,3-dioxygenase-like lactoylglutathione lyase family enzyme